jgi:hypothetical protein
MEKTLAKIEVDGNRAATDLVKLDRPPSTDDRKLRMDKASLCPRREVQITDVNRKPSAGKSPQTSGHMNLDADMRRSSMCTASVCSRGVSHTHRQIESGLGQFIRPHFSHLRGPTAVGSNA